RTLRALLAQGAVAGQAVLVRRQPRLGQRRSGRVAGREHRRRGRPRDLQVRVERVDAVFHARVVDGGAQVHHGGVVGQRAEAVPEPFGEVDRPPVHLVQAYRLPGAEAGRAAAQVHHHIQHRPAYTGDVLRLAGRDVGVVDAPHHPAGGDGEIRL